ncbi:MAG: hypothetical protein OXP71_07290 [Candidatus Poribacteria bacterium]|nr:hypothetical protein [Candidatus Poribacteria bacterium]
MKKPRTSLGLALRGNRAHEKRTELNSEIDTLFETLSGFDLAAAIIERVHHFAVESLGMNVDGDFVEMSEDETNAVQEIIRKELGAYISHFILDEHREFVVRAHARGSSTSEAVMELMSTDTTISRLAFEDAMGFKALREDLILRMSYLKPGTARWPQKKYGAVWREAREEHLQSISDIPLTSPVEHIAVLSQLAEQIIDKLGNARNDLGVFQMLLAMLHETLEKIREITGFEELSLTGLSAPDLLALSRIAKIMFAARDKKAIDGETAELIGDLERLRLALNAPEEKTDGNGTKALPAPGNGGAENAD